MHFFQLQKMGVWHCRAQLGIWFLVMIACCQALDAYEQLGDCSAQQSVCHDAISGATTCCDLTMVSIFLSS